MTHLGRTVQYNWRTLRASPLGELSGSLGDLGTLLPLLVALALNESISLPSTLIFTGIFNIITGIFFGIPLPVQPMKAIASIALARDYKLEETAAAGIGVSAVVALMGATGLLRWLARVVPIPVVKGIQVGAGLSLVLSAGEKMFRPLSWTGPSPFDNLLWAAVAALALLVCTRRPRVPYALIVFTLGLLFGTLRLHSTPITPIAVPRFPAVIPAVPTFVRTFFEASLGQLPLTTLNSIIAVAHLSADLLPDVPAPSVTAIGLSVACMNLVGCWFGAMPVCHGSGGLAAQHRFGARSGASVFILGTAKMLLGLFSGEGLVRLLACFPKAVLGVMVLAAGIELARVGESLNIGARDLSGDDAGTTRVPEEDERRDRWAVMLVTVAALLAFRNDAVGFIAGMVWHHGLRIGKPRTSQAYVERSPLLSPVP
ncbi:hypothetical protein AURDEDRAFT_112763 [Auricularia subglabra TFB-10046 SS5]|nr:hypothetical protein AURDEDRAFT_112763 [Auricularia subglabra TFB-10046 SS5]